MEVAKKLSLIFLIVLFVSVSLFSHAILPAKADTAGEIQDKLDSYEKKLKVAQQQLAAEQSKLYKNQSQIGATQTLIKKLQEDIYRQEMELKHLNDRAELNKIMLAGYIRQLYYADQDQDPLVNLSIFQGNLSDIAANPDNMISIKTRIMDSLQVINDAKTEAEKTKAGLADLKQDNQQTLKTQQTQQAQIADNVQEVQATVGELNAKIDKMRGALSALLGISVSAKDIVDAAKIASKETGVRKDFILGELVVETDLGRFTGGCYYKNTRMHSYDIPIFKSIMKELDYSLNEKKVSCAPKSGGYGGAMGVAQFIPSTWSGWKSKIAAKTGHNPPDPWSITDGVMGMALKLAAGGATSKSGEKAASMIYYCGTSKPTETYKGRVAACKNYAERVQYWADNYEKKLN